MDIARIQRSLVRSRLGAWLLCDFRNRDPFSRRILGLGDDLHCTRRWFYLIPQRGSPRKVVSAVEPDLLSALPGKTFLYRTWSDLHGVLGSVLRENKKSLALQYSPQNAIPYLSTVDGGTVELLRGLGCTLVSSAPLLHSALSELSEAQYRNHIRAGKLVDGIRRSAFERVARAIAANRTETERSIQQFIQKQFQRAGLVSADPPMVGVNGHPADPHFEVSLTKPARIKRGDTLLIDLWAKFKASGSVYYDSTWVAYVGARPPKLYQTIWSVVRDARDAAIERVVRSYEKGKSCTGADVDDAARRVITAAGFGRYFVHRTGHSITESTHGEGVNMDNFETADTREILPGSCFSIEPGIYLPGKMAVRSEINMFIRKSGKAEVTGEVQRELMLLSE